MPESNQTTLETGVLGSDLAQQQFVIKSMLNTVRTSLPVKVIAVTNSGGVSPIGYVNIQPMVSQLAGDGSVIDHGTIYNVPYLRIQGGSNAVILDPQVGDIGVASFSDRDISTVKATKSIGAPGSNRRFDMSDAVYHHSIIASAPVQYIQFNSSGITIHSPTLVKIEAPTAQVDCTTATINATTSAVNASSSASVTSPSISLGASGQTLRAFVTSLFKTLYNSHTHTSSAVGTATSIPNQQMDDTYLTTTVKGG